MAVAKIQSGMAECIIAGGAESMSSVPMTGFKPELNYDTVAAGHADYYWGMGNTAEEVAQTSTTFLVKTKMNLLYNLI